MRFKLPRAKVSKIGQNSFDSNIILSSISLGDRVAVQKEDSRLHL